MDEKQKAIHEEVMKDLSEEHCYSCDKWGTDFDDHNTINDWVAYANIYMGRAVELKASKEHQYNNLKKATNILINALETFKRNDGFAPRHYE